MVAKTLEEVLYSIFQGESNASNRYALFARESKNKVIKKVFATTSLAEKIHAEKMRKLALRSGLDMNKFVPEIMAVTPLSDKENLESGIKGEIYESTILYPQLAKVATEQNNKIVCDTINSLGKVETEHAKLFQDIIDNFLNNDDDEVIFYLCPSCGNIYRDNLPDKCLTCDTLAKMFQKY